MKILAVALLLMSTGSAAAIDCRAQPTDESGWSWRTVAGKRCWYAGPRGLDKAKLRWPAQVSAKKRPRVPLDADGNVIHTEEEKRLLESYWPPLPGAKQ